jgi:iron(III) transport system permease protein
VIGLAYIFFFNPRGWDVLGVWVPNPFNFLYGTMAILVISNIVHFYTVGFLTATTALKQLDDEFENVSASMGVPFYKTFTRVTVPVCLPAVLEIGMYFFVNSMATVSAVIFLYSADISLASVAVANMDDAGDTAPAAAMSVLIVLANIGVRVVYGGLTRSIKRRSQAWAKG